MAHTSFHCIAVYCVFSVLVSYITLQIVTMVFLAVVVGFIYFQIDDNKSTFGLTNRYLVVISFLCGIMWTYRSIRCIGHNTVNIRTFLQHSVNHHLRLCNFVVHAPCSHWVWLLCCAIVCHSICTHWLHTSQACQTLSTTGRFNRRWRSGVTA